MKEHLKQVFADVVAYALAFIRWLVLGITVGALSGVVGALFSKSIAIVTELREADSRFIFILPFAGLLSVAIYKLCRAEGMGTNQVFESVRSEKKVSLTLAPAVFVGSVLTHLGGGSAGREGAALQLGGSVSSLVSHIFKVNEKTRHVLTMCGMGALFSAVFGTPLAACVFALEVVSIGNFCSAAFFPAIVSSISAFVVSRALGVEGEHFSLSSVPSLSPDTLWRVALIAIIAALVSVLFCKSLHFSEHIFQKNFKNTYLRAFVGGALIVFMTIAVGSMEYNGGGIHVINRIFTDGTVKYEAFLIKILFTAVTVGAGFKGGEIVPTLFIGATLGGALSGLVGVPTGFGAAVGISALFAAVTNCPLATILLSLEMFGSDGMVFFALSAVISFLLSGKNSLYSSQNFVYSKLEE